MMIIMLRGLVARHLCSQQIFYLENLWCPGHGHLCHQRVSSQSNCAINFAINTCNQLCNQPVQSTYQLTQSSCAIKCVQVTDTSAINMFLDDEAFSKIVLGGNYFRINRSFFNLLFSLCNIFVLLNKLQIVQHL